MNGNLELENMLSYVDFANSRIASVILETKMVMAHNPELSDKIQATLDETVEVHRDNMREAERIIKSIRKRYKI